MYDITPGFTFLHPTQGTCTVITTTRAGRVRYEFGAPGWARNYAVTSVHAIASLLTAGVLTAPSANLPV